MDNLLEVKECRICLEDDLETNMITPCLCSGTNKYVHHDCLKKFIILSSNQNYKNQCYICKYEYNYEIKDVYCTTCNLSLFVFNILSTYLLLLYIYLHIYNIFVNIVISSFIILPFIINFFLSAKKKRKYILLKLYCKYNIVIPLIMFITGIYLLQFQILNLYGFYLENIAVFMIWNIHYKCIHKINKFEQIEILSIDNV